MILDSDIKNHMVEFRKQVTKYKHILVKDGFLPLNDKETFNAEMRIILKHSNSKILYKRLATIFNAYGFTSVEDIKLYDFIVLCAALKNPSGFWSYSDAGKITDALKFSGEYGYDLRMCTKILCDFGIMDKKPTMNLSSWKKLLSDPIFTSTIDDNSVPISLMINIVVGNEDTRNKITRYAMDKVALLENY